MKRSYRTYDEHEVREILKNDLIFETLMEYCQFLGNMYSQSLEGKYRIKYNALYPLLFENISEEKQVELFNSFANSLNLFPIREIRHNNIILQEI